MGDIGLAVVLVALIAFSGFRQWLQHQRRAMIHKERLVAIEKGVAIPPVEQEIRRSNWNIQRFLLLAGLIWISLGTSLIVVFSGLLAHPQEKTIPAGAQWIGLAPALIGISHLIVYWWEGKKRTEDRALAQAKELENKY